MCLYLIDTENIRLNLYLAKPNKRGFGTVYVRFVSGDKKVNRISTGIKVNSDFWNKEEGRITLTNKGNRLLFDNHRDKEERLREITNKIECLISSGNFNTKRAGDKIRDITGMKRKQGNKPSIKLTTLFEGLILDMPNKKSQSSLLGIVGNFKTFLDNEKIEDKPEILNNDLMRRYRNYLMKQQITSKRAGDCLNYIFTLAGKLEKSKGYEFTDLNKNKIEKIADNRKIIERLRGIALTVEEIDQIKGLKLTGDLEVYRDLFLLQCFTGIRFEDMDLLLSPENYREVEGKPYIIFNNQKTGSEGIIPMTGLFEDITEIWHKYEGRIWNKNEGLRYNRSIREIAKLAGLNREIKRIEERAGKKREITGKIYELITSHCGRHTFITNCQRYKHLTPAEIKKITGHSESKMIEQNYNNSTTEDNIKSLSRILTGENRDKEPETKQDNKGDLLGEIIVYLSKYLRINIRRELSLSEIIGVLEEEKNRIIEKFGEERYRKTKDILKRGRENEEERRLIEVLFIKGVKRKIKISRK